MKKFLSYLILAILFISFGMATFLYMGLNSFTVEKITDDLHVISGKGGNVAVLNTEEGAILVDSMSFSMQGERIRKKAEELTNGKVIMVINTHYHLDHTHGNPAFEAGTRVVSTERTQHHLKTLDAKYWTGDAAQLLPNEVFDHARTLRIGGKTVQLLHPGKGHTDGDLVVLFVEDKTIAMGDLLFNNYYPNIDLEAGGSVQQWPATLDIVLELPFETVIPGHGELIDLQGVKRFQEFMAELAALGKKAINEGLSLQETLQSAELTKDEGYEEIHFFVPLGINRDFVIRRAWQEASEL